jgi:hypothetical protein
MQWLSTRDPVMSCADVPADATMAAGQRAVSSRAGSDNDDNNHDGFPSDGGRFCNRWSMGSRCGREGPTATGGDNKQQQEKPVWDRRAGRARKRGAGCEG